MIVFHQQKSSKNEIVKQIVLNADGNYHFPKVVVLSRSMKGAVAGFFPRAPC